MEMLIGRYIPEKTFMHRLDPRTKILSLILIIIGLFVKAEREFFIYELSAFFILFITTIFISIMSKIKLKKIFKLIKLFISMFIVILFIAIITRHLEEYSKTVIFTLPFWNLKLYAEQLIFYIHIILRVSIIIMSTVILSETTNPLSLNYGLEKLNKPWKALGIPTDIFALMTSIAIRFIPTFLNLIKIVSNAQATRGLDIKNSSFKDRIKAYKSHIIPVFAFTFNKADEIALSIESKNYNPTLPRTRYRSLSFKAIDYITLVLVLALTITFVMLKTGKWPLL